MGKRVGRKIFGVGNAAGGSKGFFGRRSQARHHLLEDEASAYSNGTSFQKAWKEEMTTLTKEQHTEKIEDERRDHQATPATTHTTINKPAGIKKSGSNSFVKKKGRSDTSAETDEETLSRSQSSSEAPSEKVNELMPNRKSTTTHGLHIAMFPATQSAQEADGTKSSVPVKTSSYDEVELMFTISDDEEDECDEDDLPRPTQPSDTPAKNILETEQFLESPKGVADFDNFVDESIQKSKNLPDEKNVRLEKTTKGESRRRSSTDKKQRKSETSVEVGSSLKQELPPKSRTSIVVNSEKENQSSQLSRSSGLVDSKQQRLEETRRQGVIVDIGRAFMECSPITSEGQRKSFSLNCARPIDAPEGISEGKEVEADEETRLFGASITTSVASMIQQLSQTLNCGTTMAQGETGEAAILLEPEITKEANLLEAVPLGPPQEIIAQHPEDDESLGDITDYTAEASFAMKALRGKGGPDFMAQFAKGASAGANLATLTNPYSGKACGDDEREHQYFTDYEELGQESLQRGYARL